MFIWVGEAAEVERSETKKAVINVGAGEEDSHLPLYSLSSGNNHLWFVLEQIAITKI